ncbi:MAG: DUF4386 domain-containing protein [Ilumatobacter sp.]
MSSDILDPTVQPAATDRSDTSPRTAAVIAGAGYVVLFVLGVFANFFVREGLVVADDAQATATNIVGSEGLFRLGMVSFLIIFLVDVIVAWGLYIVFRRTHRDISLVAAWFRLVYTVFLGAALIYMFQALQLLSGSGVSEAIGSAEREAHALVALDMFNSAWLIGLAAFGLHLVVLGGLIVHTRSAPPALGWVLSVAGAAYVIDTVAHSVLGTYSDYESAFIVMVAVPAVIAEGWMGMWLLVRGGRAAASGQGR